MNTQDLLNTPDITNQFDPQDISNNKAMGILAYIGILVLIPILAAPKSKFARYHANQGLILFIANLIVGVVTGVISGILALITPVLSIIFGIITGLISLVFLVLAILGIVNAAQGKAKGLPFIANISILK